LTAEEAARALGVSRATLYAYVSRGLLRSEPGGDQRRRLYPAASVAALVRRKEERHEPEKVAERALTWGVPVLDSQLTLIADGALYYRGRDATLLARQGETLERVAALLWLGDLGAPLVAPPREPLPWSAPPFAELQRRVAALRPLARMQVLLPLAAAADARAYDTRAASVVASGLRWVRLLAAAAVGAKSERQAQGSAAAILARAWAPRTPGAERLLNAALVLSADHELNVSAFTARCVASAGAATPAVLAAGLAALGGARHGGYTDRVEAFLSEVATAGEPRERVADRLRRGEEIPAYGHHLYPDGDPRGALLLELAASLPGTPEGRVVQAVARAVEELLGERPTLDYGLVALARALALPPGAALALFAVGRSVGWIAHALEQVADGRMIRPRARYVGQEPARDRDLTAGTREERTMGDKSPKKETKKKPAASKKGGKAEAPKGKK